MLPTRSLHRLRPSGLFPRPMPSRARMRQPPRRQRQPRHRMTDLPRPLTDHLEELRRRLFWILGTWAVCFAVAYTFAQEVFEILMKPAVAAALGANRSLVALAPAELFMSYIKGALLGGFLVALPMTLYQIWAFISPGLYAGEKRMALPFVICTTL